MSLMKNNPKTVEEAKALVGTSWSYNGQTREITRVENTEQSQFDNTIMADVYWRSAGGNERKKPTPLTSFRTWLNKAKLDGNFE